MAELPHTKTNIVELTSGHDSKIQHVSLYTGLAEITRVCTPKLKAGSNQLVISGLPNVMLKESLRVEGRGPCIIHEVSISEIPIEAPRMTSPMLEDLLRQKTRISKALIRCNTSIAGVDAFYRSFRVENVDAMDLVAAGREVEGVSAELDDRSSDLQERMEQVEREIEQERKTLGEVKDDKLRQRVSIMVFGEKECDVEVVLIYGVTNATWDAAYDVYVTMDAAEKPVSLIYKSAILQSTGEAWNDVALSLETVTPSFGVSIPVLAPMTLSVYTPPPPQMTKSKKRINAKPEVGGGGRHAGKEQRRRMQSYSRLRSADEVDSSGDSEDDAPMVSRGLRVSSKGDINATFSVPGLISIPSDGTSHNVTITELKLSAVMSWITVPKKGTTVHLTAKVKNDSEYTLLRGVASVYVDGSFISRSDVPAVSPQESFDCPLGVDPSIRVVYHPRSKHANRSGFARKTSSYTFEQRITLTNTKASSIQNLKVLEQFPVSEDATIVIKLTSPSLAMPQPNKKGEYEKSGPVRISGDVLAQWDGENDLEMDPSLLGKDGKFSWNCSMISQGKLRLLLSWEVVCPSGSNVIGLDDIQ